MSKTLAVKPGVIQFLYSHGPLAPIEEVEATIFKYMKDYAIAKTNVERDLILRCTDELVKGYACHPSNEKKNIERVVQFCNDCFGKIEG